MKAIRNTTQAPLRVPLGSGKFLHLGPGQTGNVADGAPDVPAFKKLLKSKAIVIEDENGHSNAGSQSGGVPREFAHGHAHSTKVFPSGNRGG